MYTDETVESAPQRQYVMTSFIFHLLTVLWLLSLQPCSWLRSNCFVSPCPVECDREELCSQIDQTRFIIDTLKTKSKSDAVWRLRGPGALCFLKLTRTNRALCTVRSEDFQNKNHYLRVRTTGLMDTRTSPSFSVKLTRTDIVDLVCVLLRHRNVLQ